MDGARCGFSCSLFSRYLSRSRVTQVVPDGWGVTYMTGFDGTLLSVWLTHFLSLCSRKTDVIGINRMQFTITSRVEMPNEEFAVEISRAAGDLYAPYFSGQVPKSRLVILVDKASKQKGILIVVVWKSLVPLFGRTRKDRGDFLLCIWKPRIERIATHRIHLGHTID